jgi:hypothetical protein
MKKARLSIGAALIVGSALAVSASPALAASFKVGTGQAYTSIQAAVDAASDGDKIIVYPGEYMEPSVGEHAVHITKALKMKAKVKKSDPASVVKIVPNAGQKDGIYVEGTEATHIDGFQIKGFTVQGFDRNGIWLAYVDNFKIDSNTSIDNLHNGIWPTLSAHGQVKKNVSYGSEDSALWVEASTDVRVQQNELYNSVTGLEVTISEGVVMSKNIVHDNVIGVGLYHPNGAGMDIPPGLVSGGWVLSSNHIYNNNLPNPVMGGSLVASLPSGGGVLVLGIDGLQADKNLIEDNNFFGIAVVDYCAAVEGGGNDCNLNPAIVEGMPESNIFSNNTLVNNGTNPPMGHPLAAYAADVTAILTDIFDPNPSPPYLPNVFCGTTPSTFTKAGLGSPLYSPKC